jgi:hypothetical protein
MVKFFAVAPNFSPLIRSFEFGVNARLKNP